MYGGTEATAQILSDVASGLWFPNLIDLLLCSGIWWSPYNNSIGFFQINTLRSKFVKLMVNSTLYSRDGFFALFVCLIEFRRSIPVLFSHQDSPFQTHTIKFWPTPLSSRGRKSAMFGCLMKPRWHLFALLLSTLDGKRWSVALRLITMLTLQEPESGQTNNAALFVISC